tara:strand:+ start:67 stop:636 length:570 start_codon:yes stop_codon:yes gene_type:complete
MGIPYYGMNKDGNSLDSVILNHGFREITVVTAGDASHTLTDADGGIVLISAALADGAVIKLPSVTADNIGLEFRILFTGTMAGAAKIQLEDAGDAVFAGCIIGNRCGNGAGVADAAAVNRTSVVTTVAQGEKSLELDENDVTFGGGIGSEVVFRYASPKVVMVTGTLNVNVASTAVDLLQATTFTGTGY